MNQMQRRLCDFTGRGSYTNWGVNDLGIGGTLVNCPLMMLSDAYDFTANARTSTSRICFCITLRNDVDAAGSEVEFAQQFEALIASCIHKRKDFVFITDPPEINMSTGEIVDGATWNLFYAIALDICGQYGVTVIDFNKYLRDLKSDFGIDLRSFMSDAKHPNDSGYLLCGDMVFTALTSMQSAAQPNARVDAPGSNYSSAFYNFTASGGTISLIVLS